VELSATMFVFSVMIKVFPVASAEIGLGMTRSNASFASGDVGFESLHAATRNIRTMHTAQLKYTWFEYDRGIDGMFYGSEFKQIISVQSAVRNNLRAHF
jgi:hypothetical protein